MDVSSLIVFLAIGAIAGWLAGVITKGGGFGLLGDIVIGILGAVVGGYVFGIMGVSAGGFVGAIVTATVGAVILLFLIRLIKRA
ncbi:MAG: GlsB/YeaQ/YmgE family stress response membrane protein [Oleibacter sp.]|nr:GlsB/YeaQ/YmgE family stress response membrane protein [Thalassolituus sp.]